MKTLFAILVVLYSFNASSQTTESPTLWNLDFETVEKGMPAGWNNFGSPNYTIASDSIIKRSGKYAASIEFSEAAPDFKALAFNLPNNYAGKEITLSGYIKTENVTDGFVGLWMRIDPGIAFDNMQDFGLKGTTDWTKYEITLDMDPEKTERIVLGGLMAGTGKIWLDDFTVTIDGKNIRDLKPFQRKIFPAELDKEFDEGSQIADFTPNAHQVENLTSLGYVWGFLKYYHPNVAKGDYNWDYELFRILPKMIAATNNSERDAVLMSWIDGLGEFPKGKKLKVKAKNVKIEPDFAWIDNSNFSVELVSKLVAVKNAKRSDENYYMGLRPGVRNPDIKNENAYGSMKYPDAGFRLLAAYRYWNIIQYYFPYKHLIEEDWKLVLEEFIPTFLAAKNDMDYSLRCLEIIGRVHDSHASIWGKNEALDVFWGVNYAPIEVTFIENKAVVTDFHDAELGKQTGLEIGDVITAINDQSVDEMVKARLIHTPASNYPTQLRNIAGNLLCTNDSTMNITFLRNDQSESRTVSAYSPENMQISSIFEDPDTSFRLIQDGIAYINHGELKIADLNEIWKAIEPTKGLIIDIRNYPSDFPIYELSALLMPKKTSFVKFSKGSLEYPGLFTYTKPLTVGKRKNKESYKGKVIILVDETSQSSAEFHTMAYQVHPNATIIGSTTAGADGNISRFTLPGYIVTAISGIGVYYPDGTETQRIGIVPDIELRPTVKGFQAGRDELLEKAIEMIE